MKRNNLDERQEQVLLGIEHNGCWLAFWGLLAALVVQFVLFDDVRTVAGEWVIFMVLALYIAFGCLKNGIWDRKITPKATTNALLSLAAGAAVGVIVFLRVWGNYPDKIVGSICAGAFTGLPVFAICFAALTISASAYKKRRKELEKEPEDEE